jgi:outer membrane lipoprotein-sorting protein
MFHRLVFPRFFTIIAWSALLAVAVSGAAAQSVDEIIAKNIQAHGGLEKLKSVQTIRTTGKYIFPGGFRANLVEENKRPDKIREETIVQGAAAIEAYDGKTSWDINPFQGRKDPELMSEDDSKALIEGADVDGQLVDYKEKGHKAEFIGHDSVEGTDCYKIKLTLKDGTVRYYYLDADSYLELKIETQRMIRGAIQDTESYFGDYEQVNGIYFAFAFESGEKGSQNRAKMTVEKIEINVPLDDKRFELPAAPAKAAAKSGMGS